MTIATLVPIALSATGERLVIVEWLSIACIPIILASGLAWARDSATRNRARNLRQKRFATLVAVAALAMVPYSHWPLRLAFSLSRRAIARAAARAYAVSQAERTRNVKAATNSEGKVEGLCADSLYLIELLPREPLHSNIGTFALREMIPDRFAPLTLTLSTIEGDKSTLSYWSQRTVPASPDEVDLGHGWFFVSN